MVTSPIIKIAAKFFVPFTLLYGCYITLHGHLGPGGGFQGGVLIASGILLIPIAYGAKRIWGGTWHLSPKIEYLSLLGFIFIGLMAIALGQNFLTNFVQLGEPGTIPSAGYIPLLNVLIGIKVSAGIFVAVEVMMSRRGNGRRRRAAKKPLQGRGRGAK